jgi:erythromycin esterase-like protein
MVPESCEAEVIEVLSSLRRHADIPKEDPESEFNAEQNANVVVNAEHYYRTMLRGDNSSWNIRDYHMAETLGNLLRHYGKESKAIVWAHNTHVGDARYTDMAAAGMINIGQLARQMHGQENVRLVGFGTYTGSVIAGSFWDAPMQSMPVPPALPGSWEEILHNVSPHDKLLLSKEMKHHEDLWWVKPTRAIGVVYDSAHERGNYVPTLLPSRYDEYIYLDTTKALRPLHTRIQEDADYPETFPWGL